MTLVTHHFPRIPTLAVIILNSFTVLSSYLWLWIYAKAHSYIFQWLSCPNEHTQICQSTTISMYLICSIDITYEKNRICICVYVHITCTHTNKIYTSLSWSSILDHLCVSYLIGYILLKRVGNLKFVLSSP